jgi:hypothetical protein
VSHGTRGRGGGGFEHLAYRQVFEYQYEFDRKRSSRDTPRHFPRLRWPRVRMLASMFLLGLTTFLALQGPITAPATAPAAAAPPAVAPAPAAPTVCRIAVLDLIGRGLSAADKEFPPLLSEVLTSEVAAASQCQVLSQADIKSMVDFEVARAQCVDGSDSCLAELGQALGVDRIVTGSIGKLGSDYVVTARLVDISRAVVEQRAEEVVGQPERLRQAAKVVGRALFPRKTPVSNANDGPSLSPLFFGGLGVSAIGLVGAGLGVWLAIDADNKLGTPEDTDKAGAFAQARTGVAVGIAGLVVAVVGGVITSVALTSLEP